jgi:hypothetical protein
MAFRRERILRLLENFPGLTNREIADQLEGYSENQQLINQLAENWKVEESLIERKDQTIWFPNGYANFTPSFTEFSLGYKSCPKECIIKEFK